MGDHSSSAMPNGPIRRRLTTVVATDICGYSSLSEQSDQRAIQAVDTIYALFEKAVNKHQGRVFKRIADGFLAEFPSTEFAVHAAVEFTKAVKNANETGPRTTERSDIKTGIHVGDVTERDDGDLLGHGVNVAVRLQENAHINGILASQNVIDLLGQSFPYSATRRGIITLKNISKPIAVFDVMGFPQNPLQVFSYKFKTLAAKPIRVGIVSILALGLLWSGNSAIQSKALDSRLAKIQTTYFSNPSVSAYDNELNASYLYRVLQDLAESNQPSDQTVFALIETGDVEGATVSLETAIKTMDENNPKYLSSLHQIGALTYQRHPKKAIEVYEKIVGLTPTDVAAISRLGLSYDATNNVCRAGVLYKRAVDLAPQNTDQHLKLEMNRAFNYFLKGQPKEALKIANLYKNEFGQRPPDALWSQYQTNMGIYLERDGQIVRAEALLSSIIALQETLEDEVNLSRAYNVLGLINVRKAKINNDLQNLYYTSAEAQFSKQLELDNKLQRYHTSPGANYYLGQANVGLGNLDKAAHYYKQGLNIANMHGIINFQFLNELGLATVEKARGNQAATCTHIAQVQRVYNDKIESDIGPKTRTIISEMGCGFTYKPQPEVKTCSDKS